MNVDLQYAVNQLTPILMGSLDRNSVMDRVRRALDALERVAEAIQEPDSTEIDLRCTSKHQGGGRIYHCDDLDCPVHGTRNRGM